MFLLRIHILSLLGNHIEFLAEALINPLAGIFCENKREALHKAIIASVACFIATTTPATFSTIALPKIFSENKSALSIIVSPFDGLPTDPAANYHQLLFGIAAARNTGFHTFLLDIQSKPRIA